jgi:hypothetical protein
LPEGQSAGPASSFSVIFAQVAGHPGRPHPLVSILLFTIFGDFCDLIPAARTRVII